MSGTHNRSLFEDERDYWQVKQNICRRHCKATTTLNLPLRVKIQSGMKYGTNVEQY